MFVKRIPGWHLPENQATDEAVFHDRRRIVKALGLGSVLLPAAGLLAPNVRAADGALPQRRSLSGCAQ